MMPLQVFGKHPDADAYRVGGFYSPYCLVSTDKRFSDAELAAEYWALTAAYFSAQANDEEFDFSPFTTLHRFATLPHFDAWNESA